MSMQVPRLEFVTCASPVGLHRMAYWEWGERDNPRVLLCVHGLTRTGRDFDRLARALATEYRVVCPDVVGRGQSDNLLNPAFYTVPQYVSDMVTLLARINPQTLHWVGTSLGGLIGMVLAGAASYSSQFRAALSKSDTPAAGSALGVHVDKIVLNDVGPHLESAALARIGQYVGQPASFDTREAAVDYVRSVSAEFGPHTDEQWDELTEHVYKHRDGQWVKHYDLGIAVPFAIQDPAIQAANEKLLWQSYEAIDCPILIMHGENSDLLTTETTTAMLARNPNARLHDVAGVGHAPTLMHDSQIDPVARFLLGDLQ
jgi:pimeloyl-ACP methyl ester carboxylesterase